MHLAFTFVPKRAIPNFAWTLQYVAGFSYGSEIGFVLAGKVLKFVSVPLSPCGGGGKKAESPMVKLMIPSWPGLSPPGGKPSALPAVALLRHGSRGYLFDPAAYGYQKTEDRRTRKKIRHRKWDACQFGNEV